MPLTEAQLDATFTALADPTRRAIVARLTRGDATVTELAAPSGLTLPGFSKHLKVLERSGLISRSRRAQFRPCHLEWATLDEAVGWIEQNRRLWAQRFDKLDAHLRDIQEAATETAGGATPASGPARASRLAPASGSAHASGRAPANGSEPIRSPAPRIGAAPTSAAARTGAERKTEALAPTDATATTDDVTTIGTATTKGAKR